MIGLTRGGLASLDPDTPLPGAGKTADQLNAASLARQQGVTGTSQPMLVAQVLLSTQRKLQQAVEAQAQANAALQAAQSTLNLMGSDAQVQQSYELALARGESVPPPASRDVQQSRVRGLQRMADDASARVAHLSSEVTSHRRALAGALMPQALAAYRQAALELASRYADLLTLGQQSGNQLMLTGNNLRVPSCPGLGDPGGAGVLVSTHTVVDSGELSNATDRIDAEVDRLLSLLKQQEATA